MPRVSVAARVAAQVAQVAQVALVAAMTASLPGGARADGSAAILAGEAAAGPSVATSAADASATGTVHAELVVERSLFRKLATTIAPDVTVDVGPQLALSLLTSHRSRWLVDTGFGYCLDCDDLADEVTEPPVVSGVGVAARWRFAVAGLHMDALSPAKPWLQIGAYREWRWRYVDVRAQPYVGVALANHSAGNASFVNLPVRVRAKPWSWLGLALEPGLHSRIEDFTDWYSVHVNVGAEVALPGNVGVAAYIGWPRVYGQLDDARKRHATVVLSWSAGL